MEEKGNIILLIMALFTLLESAISLYMRVPITLFHGFFLDKIVSKIVDGSFAVWETYRSVHGQVLCLCCSILYFGCGVFALLKHNLHIFSCIS